MHHTLFKLPRRPTAVGGPEGKQASRGRLGHRRQGSSPRAGRAGMCVGCGAPLVSLAEEWAECGRRTGKKGPQKRAPVRGFDPASIRPRGRGNREKWSTNSQALQKCARFARHVQSWSYTRGPPPHPTPGRRPTESAPARPDRAPGAGPPVRLPGPLRMWISGYIYAWQASRRGPTWPHVAPASPRAPTKRHGADPVSRGSARPRSAARPGGGPRRCLALHLLRFYSEQGCFWILWSGNQSKK